MRHLATALALCTLLLGVSSAYAQKDLKQKPMMYPSTKQVEQTDLYHGTAVKDPYRWLEDPDALDTAEWVKAQNAFTFSFLNEIPQRRQIQERLTHLWNFERFGIPTREGGRTFFAKNDGLQNQAVIYTLRSPEETPRVLLDPNAFSLDGTVALSGTSPSPDGKLMAYGISSSGSDWMEWKVRDIETGKDLDDHLQWIKFSNASWSKDGKGFFYSRYDEPRGGNQFSNVNFYQKLYYHLLGTPQAADKLIYERQDQKEWGFGGYVTDDGHYLIIWVSQGTDPRNRLYYLDLQSPDAKVVELLNGFDAKYDFVGNDGPIFWIHTTLDAPRGRLLAIDTRKPARENWRELVGQTEDNLESVSVLNHQFVMSYLHDAHSRVKIHQLDGKWLRDVSFPGLGTAGGFGGKPEDTETYYSFTSYTTPTTIYRYDLKTGVSTVFREPTVAFSPSDYESKQVFYRSKDGTKVPMILTHKKGLKLDGQNPTYLYGYGGFNVPLTPTFSVTNLVWMEMGGLLAIPNLRGGGEYGEAWHAAGTKLQKQNVFDDFIAAAEWLIANRYTKPEKLAIGGGSNGGLLVGATMTQRPDLFAAALPAVGVLDMLRYQKFTIGWAWASDYGTAENAEEFKALYAYSPLHRVMQGTHYPATMVTTGDHDDRVVPAHSFKFAATLQAAQAGPDPVLIRIETKAGHGAGKPTTKLIEEAADRWGFLVRVLKM